jgi:uncharacterized repeat protein (TIGR01451 family)
MRPVTTSAAFLATLVAAAGFALGGAPGWASSATSTDLTVKLENKVDATPGKRVAYQVTVMNKGSHPASRVQIDFTTSVALSNVTYSIKNGHCYRSAKETACLFYAALNPRQSAQVAISGVMPKKLEDGTAVTNQVSVQSSTNLTNTKDDRAVDNYQIGVPRPLPVVAPSPSVNPGSKIVKITATASHWLGYSRPALRITFAVLAAAAVWFGVGLWMRHRQRVANGDLGDEID